MSKRSGLSRWEDLKHRFVDVGRYRYILHKFDMEPWRGKICPICNLEFTEEPRYRFMSYDMHMDCTFTPEFDVWMNNWYAEEEAAEKLRDWPESSDDAYNELVLIPGLEDKKEDE